VTDSNIKTLKLPNGITLLGEEMSGVSSAAFSVLVPVGAAYDAEGRDGESSVLVEMMNKGAGQWSSRELSQQLENIGAQRGQSAGTEVSMFSGAVLGENIERLISITSKIIREPKLPDAELESVRQLSLQELRALEDEPSHKVMVELSKVFYPHPFGRSQLGTKEGLAAIDISSLKNHYSNHFVPDGVIIGVAGKINWDSLCKTIDGCFGDWKGTRKQIPNGELSRQSSQHHVKQDTNQLQIAMAYPSVSFEHPSFYAAKVAVGVLSGGMAGRLFVEVREKRGLVYRVSASHSASKGRAAIFAYAGTTPENSQETSDVMLNELRNIKQGISEDELNRSKADLKSKVIMQRELSSVRASALVTDWWNLKRVRSLTEIKSGIDAVGNKEVIRYAEDFPPDPLTLLTLGPKTVEVR